MTYTENDTIFIQIASYRDPELQHTLQDLFKKAKKPENIFVGICHQYDMKGDEDNYLFEVPFPRRDQIRIFEKDYRETGGFGLCWSRHQSQKLYGGERWILQIDSHMRFVEEWDKILVEDIKKHKNEKVIFVTWPIPYYLETETINFMGAVHSPSIAIGDFFINKIFMALSSGETSKRSLGCIMISCFYFGDAEVIFNNITDPNLMVYDEVSSSINFFRFGASIYNYEKNVVAHLYAGNKSKKNIELSSEVTYKVSDLAKETYLHLTSIKKSNNVEVIKNIKIYHSAIGRTLRDYERFTGVNFRKIKLRERTRQNCFEPYSEVANLSKIKFLFNTLTES